MAILSRNFILFFKMYIDIDSITTNYIVWNELKVTGKTKEHLDNKVAQIATICELREINKIIELSLDVFIEFRKFSDKNICHFSKRVQTCHLLC